MTWKDDEIEGERNEYVVSFGIVVYSKDGKPTNERCRVKVWADTPAQAAATLQKAIETTINALPKI